MRTRALLALGILAVLVVIAAGYVLLAPHDDALPTVELKGEIISVAIANTDALRSKGLGGRDGLASDEGMLFIFPEDDFHGFWMKDMRFSIDMLWLSQNGTVVYIAPNVSPDTYPQVFRPARPARYVLELPAEWAKAHGVVTGDTVNF